MSELTEKIWAEPSELRPVYIRRATHPAVDPAEATTVLRTETPDVVVEVHDRPVFEARRVPVPVAVINAPNMADRTESN